MSDLTDVIRDGEIITRKNSSLDDDVRVKRGGMKEGLVHLIDHRIRERVLNEKVQMNIIQAQKETAAILFLVIDNINKAPAIKETNGNYGIYYKGIKTIITQDTKGHYVLSGYDNNQTKQEATESINAVIAQYGNTPEFLGIYAQVGAVITSNNIIPQPHEMSNQRIQALQEIISEKNNQLENANNTIQKQNITIQQQKDELKKEKSYHNSKCDITVPQYDSKGNVVKDSQGNVKTATIHCTNGVDHALGKLVNMYANLKYENEQLRNQLNQQKIISAKSPSDNGWEN